MLTSVPQFSVGISIFTDKFETRAMKLVITISITLILFHIGMGAPVDNLNEDYDYAIALLSGCTVFLHIK